MPKIHRSDLVDRWCAARWAFLTFNVVIVSGWVFWLSWPHGRTAWVVLVARLLISAQLLVGIAGLWSAYHRRLDERAGSLHVAEAWVYFGMAALCAFVLGLPLG